jgi:uncharacterized integral membrane protein
MRQVLWVLFGVIIAALVIPVGLANRQPVTLNLDPFGRAATPLALDMPLSLLMFLLFVLGVLAGGFAAWIGQSKWRRTARVKSREAYQWKAEADRLAREQTQNGGAAPSGATRGSSKIARLVYGR